MRKGYESKTDERMTLFDIAKELALIVDEIDMSHEESEEKFKRIQKAMTTNG